jgi:hypothetical protein
MNNKKILIIINAQSCIDVITNSSTELFVCDTDKTEELVDQILIEKSIGGYIKPFKFDISTYRKIIELYDDVDRWNIETSEDDFVKRNEGYLELRGWVVDAESEKDIKEMRLTIIEDGYYSYSSVFGNHTESSYKNRIREYIGKEWNWEKEHEIINIIYNEILESDTKPYWWDKPNNYKKEITAQELEGKVLIISDGDNAIDYDRWDEINLVFNGHNYHLG